MQFHLLMRQGFGVDPNHGPNDETFVPPPLNPWNQWLCQQHQLDLSITKKGHQASLDFVLPMWTAAEQRADSAAAQLAQAQEACKEVQGRFTMLQTELRAAHAQGARAIWIAGKTLLQDPGHA